MDTKWLDRSEYPFKAHYTDINGQRMHFIDEGQGSILLFVHGTPSWSFDFRNVIKVLSKQYRCIAIDQIGFGLSDKPAEYDYSTQNHSKTLETFIRRKELNNVTMVVHDFGTPIGMQVAIRNPTWFSKLVVLNGWLWSSADDPDFKRFSKLLKSPLLPFLYLRLNFSPRFIMPAAFGERKLSRHLKQQYCKPFANKSQRFGPLAFVRSLLNDQDWFQSLWQQRGVLSQKPILLIWGMQDPVLKPHMLQTFKEGFPGAVCVQLAAAGHFPQEEAPEAVAEALLAFLE